MMVPLCQIPAAVSILPFKLNKFVRGHLRLTHIAPADAVSDNQQFAWHTGWQQIAILVDHHHFDVCHRLANRNLIPSHLVEGAADCRLRWTIAVKGNGVRPQSHYFVVERLGERLRPHVKHLNL